MLIAIMQRDHMELEESTESTRSHHLPV